MSGLRVSVQRRMHSKLQGPTFGSGNHASQAVLYCRNADSVKPLGLSVQPYVMNGDILALFSCILFTIPSLKIKLGGTVI